MSLSFYTVESKYCDFLREVDKCVPYTFDSKINRPFVGILVEINYIKYYAPLSSPKPKHISMKNSVDFIKINGGSYGAINLNNMIPVPDHLLKKVIPNITEKDTQKDIQYKNLLKNQLTWCNANKGRIITKARKLYNYIISNVENDKLRNRCCDFKADELQYMKYCKGNNLEIVYNKLKLKTLDQQLQEEKENCKVAPASLDHKPQKKAILKEPPKLTKSESKQGLER